MTCEHQWHDATSSAGPEWVCGKCKVTYTETKKTLSAPKRGWVGLTDDDVGDLCGEASSFGTSSWVRHIEAKLRSKNT